jgi:hypothetical protein
VIEWQQRVGLRLVAGTDQGRLCFPQGTVDDAAPSTHAGNGKVTSRPQPVILDRQLSDWLRKPSDNE